LQHELACIANRGGSPLGEADASTQVVAGQGSTTRPNTYRPWAIITAKVCLPPCPSTCRKIKIEAPCCWQT
jgi:hypothetical protein